MAQTPDTMFRERLVAALLTVMGILAFAQSLSDMKIAAIRSGEYLLAFLFVGSIVLANQYPIHLLRGTKLSLINVPIFLAAALLPAPLAIFAAGGGLLIANILTRVERGLLPRDITSTVSQWMVTVFLGYQIIHLTLPGFHGHVSRFSLLILCAVSFILIDFVVFSLSQSFVFMESFIPTLKSVIREGTIIEIAQYLIAILGVLAADENIWSLGLLVIPLTITYFAFKNIKEVRQETVRILNDMADTVDLRDMYTGGHSNRVADLVHQILIQLNVAGPEASLIEMSARLHDIGKIGIPDTILMKPGTLSAVEMSIMQAHPQKGAELISKYKDFSRGASIIMHHHERWDGDGYPARLKGYEIPFGARVLAVADSFDAMTSDRPYRKALSVYQSIQILLEGRGTQWEPAIVNAFVDMIMSQMVDEALPEHLFQMRAPSTLSQTALVTS
jgi:HD-GYP domain-containing protein (c-di-GMP phosphodiesterase class II)